ncbi:MULTISPECIES: hypothetical protein [unclassified Marinobacterium]|uniref:hypothetical protein n=1 Tax=unclassified Marinobacterium TaxID=2644139 RepID=UPI001568B101|nr:MULTISPECIES: hypothetical protein [unclassified Marinobacterium]NRP10381.1 hypothetical protein [Marinobacterium sp. xm-g-48]NRP83480.1 hypothetical protein [Marinobacterium sp. xm-d-509]
MTAGTRLSVHNTTIDISSVSRVFSDDVLEHIVGEDAINRYKQLSVSMTRQVLYAYRYWAEFIDYEQDIASQYLRSYQGEATPSKLDFLIHLDRFERHLISQHNESVGRRNKIRSGLNWLLKDLANQRIVPSGLGLSSVGDKGRQIARPKAKKKVVTEAHSATKIDDALRDSISSFVGSISAENEDRDEMINLVINSVKELSASGEIGRHSTNDFSTIWPLVEAALHRRLIRIRELAERIYQEEISKRDTALSLAAKGESVAKIVADYFTVPIGKGSAKNGCSRNPLQDAFDGLTAKDVECGLLAAYLDPSSPLYLTGYSHKTRGYQRFNKYRKANDIGLADQLSASDLIGASTRLLVSAQIILIYDLVANVGGVRSLKRTDYLNIGDVLASISWDKPRAKSRYNGYEKLRGTEKPTSSSDVFTTIKAFTDGYANWRSPGIFFRTLSDGRTEHDLLFLKPGEKATVSNSLEVKGCDDTWFNKHTQEILSKVAEGITATSIRSSIILLDAVRNGEDSARNTARHESKSAIRGYIYKLGFTDKLESKMRAFIGWLEALATLDIDDYAERAGYDQAEFMALQDRIRKDGFGGVICKDSDAGFQPEGNKNGCGLFLKCITCDNREPSFFATQDNVVQLVMWGAAIENGVDAGIIKKDIDGSGEWTMWALFVQTVYERLDNDPRYKSMLIEAEQYVRNLPQNPYQAIIKHEASKL